MSAWVVQQGHIDVLVNGLAQYRLITPTDMRAVGQMLLHENYLSVNARYGEDDPTPSYQLRVTEASLDPRHVVAAIHCYEYQTCEHNGWAESDAHALMLALYGITEPLAAELPNWPTVFAPDDIGTRWGYQDLTQALA